MSTIEPPPKPEQKEPAVDIRTLAYLLREIDNEAKDSHRLQRMAGWFLFLGSFGVMFIGGGVASQTSDSSLLAAGLVIGAYGFSKLF